MSKKRFTNKFKAEVGLAAVKSDRTVSKIASEYGVHPSQVSAWKKELSDNVEQVFGDNQAKELKVLKSEKQALYQQIGQLSVERDWLKKKLGYQD